ncbi:MAG: Fe-S-containing hydro-lyase [Cellulosilyticaceae bacterium]
MKLVLPMTKTIAQSLTAGEKIFVSGVIYTARDAAHKKMKETYDKGEKLPIELRDSAIYYAGPSPKKPGQVIGSCGPTTSGRMDAYASWMISMGQTVMIGKGLRNQEVIQAMKKDGAVYLTAIGGAGALLSKCVLESEVVAYEELGAEAIYKLTVENFPVIVTIDAKGNNLYETEKYKYKV